MRPSRPCLRLLCPRPRAWLLGFVLLVGRTACGSPSPEGPVSSPSTGSADAVVSPSAGDASRAGLAAHEPAHQIPTQMASLGPTTPHASPPGTRSTESSRAARVPPAAASAGTPPSDAQTHANQAQREAREQWFAELRESPDAAVRLQALETWAQQPGTGIDPLTYALVDEDEEVRARAEELYEQQLAREEAAAL